MIELLAILMIVAGLFLIFKGLITESEGLEEGWMADRYWSEDEEEWEWRREAKKDRERRRTEVKAGGVVLIGPIPIVFGDSKYAFYALILTILLMFMVILLMFWRW